jgi:hypothetical protein
MITEIRGDVPKLPFPMVRTLINRAWKDVRRNNLWGFQLYDGPQWISPLIVSTGLATTVQGSSTVTLDATATAAVNASAISASYSPIIQRQFRIGAGTIYNIWGWNSLGTLTLDRPYGETSGTIVAYNILQVYYPAPYEDHRTWVTVRDMIDFMNLRTNMTREQIDGIDPQRTWYYMPTAVVYYQQDQNPASSTYRFPMYELWGLPTSARNYQLYGIREYPDLSANDDTLPPAIGEDLVTAQARYYAYQWAEANKGTIPRNQGPDFKFLMSQTAADYKRLLREYRRNDRETVNNWYSVRRLGPYYDSFASGPYYSTTTGTASVGRSF